MKTGETFATWTALLAWDNCIRSTGDTRVFQCPGCLSWASLGENARNHAFHTGHGLARLEDRAVLAAKARTARANKMRTAEELVLRMLGDLAYMAPEDLEKRVVVHNRAIEILKDGLVGPT